MVLMIRKPTGELLKYRPEVDGLRAIAILPVVFFHSGLKVFSGGFVGVDIFFVLSGYLITTIVAGDVEQGQFSFEKFYERRVRRIFPALLTVLFASTLGAVLVLPPNEFAAFGKSLVAVTFFVGNIFFWQTASTGGYFDSDSSPLVVLHTWTLSVEEQFYIFLPIALVLLYRWRPRYLKAGLIAATIASFALNLWMTEYKPIGAFYLLPARAWELLIGSLLAVRALPPVGGRIAREAAGFLGLGLIAFAVFSFSGDTPFPGVYALAPCLGAGLIIYASEPGPSLVKATLGFRPLVFIGLLSYSLYLWHWPLIVFLRYFQLADLTGIQAAGVIVASFCLAYLSYVCIETPFRRKKLIPTRTRLFWFGALASVLCVACGLSIFLSEGFPQRFDAQTQKILADNAARKSEHGALGNCTHWRQEINSVNEVTGCPIGPGHGKNVMFWGDSHVEELQLSIRRLYDRGIFGDRGVLFALADGCPPSETLTVIRSGAHCKDFSHLAMLRAQRNDVDAVFIAFSTWWDEYAHVPLCVETNGECGSELSRPEMERIFVDELEHNVRTLRALGKTVVISLPAPEYDRDIPDLAIHNAMFGRYGSFYRPQEVSSPDFRERIRTTASRAGAILFDPRESLCKAASCTYENGGVSIYIDHHHVAISETTIFDTDMAIAFTRTLGVLN